MAKPVQSAVLSRRALQRRDISNQTMAARCSCTRPATAEKLDAVADGRDHLAATALEGPMGDAAMRSNIGRITVYRRSKSLWRSAMRADPARIVLTARVQEGRS